MKKRGHIETRRKKPPRDQVFLLIDGSHVAYRAFHTRQLSTEEGVGTSVLSGLIQAIDSNCWKFNTSRFIVVMDAPGMWRRAAWAQYKSRHFDEAKRDERKQVREQIETAQDAMDMLGIPWVHCPKLEADDVCGLISHNLSNALERGEELPFKRIVIVTDDRDYLQLINDYVWIYRPIARQMVNADRFERHYGIRPSQFVAWKAMVGEPPSGDNIPGVTGIGEQRATQLLQSHGSLYGIGSYLNERIRTDQATKQERTWQACWMFVDVNQRLAKIITDWSEFEDDALLKPEFNSQNLADIKKRIRAAYDLALAKRVMRVKDIVRFRDRFEFAGFDARRFCANCGFTKE